MFANLQGNNNIGGVCGGVHIKRNVERVTCWWTIRPRQAFVTKKYIW